MNENQSVSPPDYVPLRLEAIRVDAFEFIDALLRDPSDNGWLRRRVRQDAARLLRAYRSPARRILPTSEEWTGILMSNYLSDEFSESAARPDWLPALDELPLPNMVASDLIQSDPEWRKRLQPALEQAMRDHEEWRRSTERPLECSARPRHRRIDPESPEMGLTIRTVGPGRSERQLSKAGKLNDYLRAHPDATGHEAAAAIGVSRGELYRPPLRAVWTQNGRASGGRSSLKASSHVAVLGRFKASFPTDEDGSD